MKLGIYYHPYNLEMIEIDEIVYKPNLRIIVLIEKTPCISYVDRKWFNKTFKYLGKV